MLLEKLPHQETHLEPLDNNIIPVANDTRSDPLIVSKSRVHKATFYIFQLDPPMLNDIEEIFEKKITNPKRISNQIFPECTAKWNFLTAQRPDQTSSNKIQPPIKLRQPASWLKNLTILINEATTCHDFARLTPIIRARSESAQNESAQNESAQNESPQNESPQNESAQNESAQNESAQNESAQNESAQNESPQNESAQNESAQNESAQNESAQNESAQNESAQNESAQNESAQNEVADSPVFKPCV
nr:ribosome-binding protein 1-like [Procambarus clarkii]